MKTLAFGEILWDVFESESRVGGAAFNAAAHLAKLGAESYIVSAVGDDRLGDAALSCAEDYGLRADYVERRPGLDTGTVQVKLSPDGQPSYEIKEGVAWDAIEAGCDALDEIAREPWSFFVFGTLAQRSERNRRTLESLFDALPPRTKAVYDINLRQGFHTPAWIESSLKRCQILKINEDEAQFLGEAFAKGGLPVEELARRLQDKHALESVIVTLGGAGAGVLSQGAWTPVPGVKVEVADTVGAGDSFTAATLFALGHGVKAPEAVSFGTKMGGFVASRRGAVPDYDAKLQAEIARIAALPENA